MGKTNILMDFQKISLWYQILSPLGSLKLANFIYLNPSFQDICAGARQRDFNMQ
jgi:hypothetical protein